MTLVLLGPITVWFPARTVRVTELPELAALPAAEREALLSLGIEEVQRADDLTEVDLAEHAARGALERSGLPAAELDALVLVQGWTPDHQIAADAVRLCGRLGAGRAFTVSVGQLGSVSGPAALAVGAGLLIGNPAMTHVLVAGGVRGGAAGQRPDTILGDGAAAVLMFRAGSGVYQLVDHMLDNAGDPGTGGNRGRFVDLNRRLLRRNGLHVADVASVVTHNLNRRDQRATGEVVGLPVHRRNATNLARHGHLGPIDVLLNLAAVAPSTPPGGYVLVLNHSPVPAWSGALLRRRADGRVPSPSTEHLEEEAR